MTESVQCMLGISVFCYHLDNSVVYNMIWINICLEILLKWMAELRPSLFKGLTILLLIGFALFRQVEASSDTGNPCPNSMGLIMINHENHWEERSLSMSYAPDIMFHFPFCYFVVFSQCWDWTDRSSYHYGDSYVSYWVQSACLSIRYCKNHERSKSHDDPNACEYHTCCSVLQKNNFVLSSHIIRWIFNILAVDHTAKRSPLPSAGVALAPGRRKLLRLLGSSNSLDFLQRELEKSSSCFRYTWQLMSRCQFSVLLKLPSGDSRSLIPGVKNGSSIKSKHGKI